MKQKILVVFSHGKESGHGEVNLKYWLRLPIIMELK
jgi:hypothetical protein